MGKGKYKRVVLISGLLFLTIILCSFIFNHMMTQIQFEKYRVMGQLMTNHPEMELELIEAFENAENNSIDRDIKVGRALEEKYGYSPNNRSDTQYVKKHILTIKFLLVMASVLLGAILVYSEQRQNKRELEEEKTRELLKKSKDHNRMLLEKLTVEEKETKSLVTDISHQLKTPLASLKMSYEIAQSDDFTYEERNSFFTKGRQEISKLESLLEALLNLARLETNMIQIKPVSCSLKKTLVGAVNSVYMKAYKKNIEIVMEEILDMNIMHDSKWTQEAFVNVLDNAIKYSNRETTVKIKVSPMVTYVMIEIEDEGMGIPVKEYSNIFKRFYRVDNGLVLNTEGSGVGLYLVRKILEEQGGSVRVKQGITGGSIFQMTLPKS